MIFMLNYKELEVVMKYLDMNMYVICSMS